MCQKTEFVCTIVIAKCLSHSECNSLFWTLSQFLSAIALHKGVSAKEHSFGVSVPQTHAFCHAILKFLRLQKWVLGFKRLWILPLLLQMKIESYRFFGPLRTAMRCRDAFSHKTSVTSHIRFWGKNPKVASAYPIVREYFFIPHTYLHNQRYVGYLLSFLRIKSVFKLFNAGVQESLKWFGYRNQLLANMSDWLVTSLT